MCQLTFISGDPLLARSVLFNIPVINSRAGNSDGFGYYHFDKQKIFKTKESAGIYLYKDEFLDRLDEDFPLDESKRVSILSHVRSASRYGGKMQEINDENAHPFRLNNIVLAHNGTLYPKDDKDEIKGKIDSYWFLSKLCEVVGDKKLTHKDIIKAMEYFEGKFALLIVDLLQPNNLWIAKGRTADLYTMTFKDENDKELLFIINTKEEGLKSTISPYFHRVLLGKNVFVSDITKFKDETVYRYNTVSRKMFKYKEEIKEEAYVVKTQTYSRGRGYNSEYGNFGRNRVSNTSTFSSIKDIFGNILEESSKSLLTYSEVAVLYELYIGDSIYKPEKDDLIIFSEMLKKLNKEAIKGRAKTWINISKRLIEEGYDVMDLYQAWPEMAFPWFLNTKGKLKYIYRKLSTIDFDGYNIQADE
jgi:predicted glutamine amidotransferase